MKTSRLESDIGTDQLELKGLITKVPVSIQKTDTLDLSSFHLQV